MTSLITGINGFIGFWLSKFLLSQGDKVIGFSRNISQTNNTFQEFQGDILDTKRIRQILKKTQPDRIFHLAAQSNIPLSFKKPQETFEINVQGTMNILQTLSILGKKTVFISIGSSAEYGKTALTDHFLSETSPLAPISPYGVSKAGQGYLVRIYNQSFGLNAIHVRPFAIIGPRKIGDAISDFARGIVAVEKGERRSLAVGSLSHTRDFLDVRDFVSALDLIAKKGERGEVYNICKGIGIKLQEILEILIRLSKVKIKVKIDENKIRPVDDPIIIGNPQKLTSLGFKPKYILEETLSEILNYWRKLL